MSRGRIKAVRIWKIIIFLKAFKTLRPRNISSQLFYESVIKNFSRDTCRRLIMQFTLRDVILFKLACTYTTLLKVSEQALYFYQMVFKKEESGPLKALQFIMGIIIIQYPISNYNLHKMGYFRKSQMEPWHCQRRPVSSVGVRLTP